MVLYDKKLGIVHVTTTMQPVSSYSNSEPWSREPPTTTDITYPNEISIITNTTSYTTASSYSTIKQPKLTPKDRENIKKLYQDLDPSKKRILSTGTVVENKMAELALACNYEQYVTEN